MQRQEQVALTVAGATIRVVEADRRVWKVTFGRGVGDIKRPGVNDVISQPWAPKERRRGR